MFEKRGFGKKADIETAVYFFILQMVLIGVVFVTLIAYVFGVANNTLLEKNYLSRDLALLIDTMYAAPGNVDYSYEGDLSKYGFTVGLSPYKVSVYEKDEKKETAIVYPFMEDSSLEFVYKEFSLEKNERLRFAKEANVIRVDKNLIPNMEKLTCPEIDTTRDRRSIVIDFEEDQFFRIAKEIESLAPTKNLEVGLTKREEKRTLEERQRTVENKNPDVVISLKESQESNVRVYFHSNAEQEIQKKSQKLGCLIMNEIAESEGYTTIKPIPKEPQNEILSEARVSIILEVKDSERLAKSIINGLGEYYGE